MALIGESRVPERNVELATASRHPRKLRFQSYMCNFAIIYWIVILTSPDLTTCAV